MFINRPFFHKAPGLIHGSEASCWIVLRQDTELLTAPDVQVGALYSCLHRLWNGWLQIEQPLDKGWFSYHTEKNGIWWLPGNHYNCGMLWWSVMWSIMWFPMGKSELAKILIRFHRAFNTETLKLNCTVCSTMMSAFECNEWSQLFHYRQGHGEQRRNKVKICLSGNVFHSLVVS